VAIETVLCYVGIEVVAANVLEPLLFGSSTGIATIAVLVAAAFWTWLWGPVGLLLSTPMTVCLVVAGKYVPQLEFLNIMLGDEPALDPPQRIYQRLLSLDQEEAMELATEYSKKMPIDQLYDEVLLPALSLAKRDHQLDDLDEERHEKIVNGMREMLDELADRHRAVLVKEQANEAVERAKADLPTTATPTIKRPVSPVLRHKLPAGCEIKIAILPANDEPDEVAGLMFAQLLEFRGYCARLLSVEKLASEMISSVQEMNADLMCVSALPPAAVSHARGLCNVLLESYRMQSC